MKKGLKRAISMIVASLLMLTLCSIPSVYAAEEETYEGNITYNFDEGDTVPSNFKNETSKSATLKINNKALEFKKDTDGATIIMTINVSNLKGYERKKGILTYSFDLVPETSDVLFMLGNSSKDRGFQLAAVRYNNLLTSYDYTGNSESGSKIFSGGNNITVQFNFETQKMVFSAGVGEGKKSFEKDMTQYKDKSTNKFANADKFQLILRGPTTFTIDNFSASYTEKYTFENIEKVKAVVAAVNEDNAVLFRENITAAAPIMKAVGYEAATTITTNSDEVLALIVKAVHSEKTYPVDTNEKVWASVDEIMEEIKNANVPLLSINAAATAEEMEKSLLTYYKDYEVDEETIEAVEAYSEWASKLFYDSLLQEKSALGKFSTKEEIQAAIKKVQDSTDNSVAFQKYNEAHALTLPRVFEEFKYVAKIDMSYIEDEYKNQTLFILKTKSVASYKDIPAELLKAYNEAKLNPEIFSDAKLYEANEENYTIIGYEKETTVLPNEKYFVDMTDFEWAQDAVEDLYSNGAISGKGERIFAPRDNVTREEFVKMIVEVFDVVMPEGESGFADVDESEWYAPYIKAACDAGIIKGYSNGKFGVGDYITREDVATILYRAANVKNIQLKVEISGKFDDAEEISEYAQNSVGVLKSNEIISGVGENIFAPKLNTNRAEAAVMIYRLFTFGG